MPVTKIPAKPPANLQRESWVLAGVLQNLLPGNVSMDALEIKFSVISLPPQSTMSSEEENIFEGLLALDQKYSSNS